MRVPLRAADVVVLTKGALVSPAEREIAAALVARLNPKATVLPFDGLTGEGLERLVATVRRAPPLTPRPVLTLRQTLPNGRCDVCQRGLQG
jgi:G3E family GTPase